MQQSVDVPDRGLRKDAVGEVGRRSQAGLRHLESLDSSRTPATVAA